MILHVECLHQCQDVSKPMWTPDEPAPGLKSNLQGDELSLVVVVIFKSDSSTQPTSPPDPHHDYSHFQERTGLSTFDHNGVSLGYKLDNEFELVFVVAYQKILQLSYVDKFLSDIHLEFRDKYKNDLADVKGLPFNDFDFAADYQRVLSDAEEWGRSQAQIPKQMRSFGQSDKSKKTVSSMIERKGEEKDGPPQKKSVKIVEEVRPSIEDDVIAANRRKMLDKFGKKPKVEQAK